MAYRIEYTEVASVEVDQVFFYLVQRSPDGAARWLTGLRAALANLAESLEVLPGQRSLAPENSMFPEVDVYQMIYGRGASAYRILYRLMDTVEDGPDRSLRVLHVIHGSRKYLSEPDEVDANDGR